MIYYKKNIIEVIKIIKINKHKIFYKSINKINLKIKNLEYTYKLKILYYKKNYNKHIKRTVCKMGTHYKIYWTST